MLWYCCRSQTMRKYLDCELNIEKLFRIYSDWTELSGVKSSYFRHVFNTAFNLGFGSPASDQCSMCLSFKERIRNEQGRFDTRSITFYQVIRYWFRLKYFIHFLDEDTKQDLRAARDIRKKKAAAFFDYLRDGDSFPSFI